jgi:RHS repeat-associated protein
MRRAVAAAMEHLETRRLLTISWLGGTGNWNDTTNWSTHTIPGSNDTVMISIPGSVVNVTDSESTASTTTAAGTTLNITSSGKFNPHIGSFSGAVNLMGQLTGGSSNAPVSFSGATDVSGGQLIDNSFLNNGAMTFDGGLLYTGALSNAGTLTFQNSSSITNNSSITNESGGNFVLADDTGISLNPTGNGIATITNSGTLTAPAGPGMSTIVSGIKFVNQSGSIDVPSGTLALADNLTLVSTTLDVATGAALFLDLGSNSASVGGTLTGTGGGTVNFNSGTMVNLHTGATDGIANGTLQFPAGMAQIGIFDFEMGGNFQLINTGELDYVGGAEHGDFNIDNQGTIAVLGTGDLALGNQTGFINERNGIINFESDAGLTTYNNGHGGGLTFTNKGLIEKTSGTGVSVIASGIPLNNQTGTFNVTSGTLSFAGTGTMVSTTLDVSAGAVFSFDMANTTTISIGGGLGGLGSGTVDFNSGTLVDEHGSTNDGFANGSLAFPPGMAQVAGLDFEANSGFQIVNSGELDYVGAVEHGDFNIDNQGTIEVLGTGDLAEGNQTGFINDTTGIIDFQTDAGIDQYSNGHGGNLTFTNKGLIEKTGGVGESIIGSSGPLGFTNDAGAFTVTSGTLSLANDGERIPYIVGALNVATGATFDLDSSGAVFIAGTLSMTGGGRVTLSGEVAGPEGVDGSSAPTVGYLNFTPGQLFITGGGFDDNQTLVNLGSAEVSGAALMQGIVNEGTVIFDAGPLRISGNLINAATGTFDFAAPQMVLALGNNGAITNQGMLSINVGTGTLDLSQNNMFNSGTIAANSGTVILPWLPNQYNTSPGLFPDERSIPAGSTFIVGAGVTVNVATAPNISIIKGSVTLAGAGATFSALSKLATVNGQFDIAPGATFTTAAALVNTGTLTVGGGLTVNGNLTESTTSGSPPPTLTFDVAGAPMSAAVPTLNVTGTTTFVGTLTAAFINGYAAVGGTAYTVANFASSAGTFASTAGVGPAFTAAINPTNIVLTTANTGAADLAVTSVSAPTSFTSGDDDTITWQVANNGGTAAGFWDDSVYLTTDGTLSDSSLLLGRVGHIGPLGPNATYTGSLTVNLPPVPAGSYKIAVLTDSGEAVPDTNRANNLGSSPTLTATIPALTIGHTTTSTIENGQSRLYSLALTVGMNISLTGSFAAIDDGEVFVQSQSLPTQENFTSAILDQTQTSGAIVIHAAQAKTYYVLVQGEPGATMPASFSLTPVLNPFGAQSISPNVGGNGGELTATVIGANFTPTTTVSLVIGQTTAAAGNVQFVNSSTLYATFPLSGVPTGVYDVQTSDPAGDHATLAGAFTVVATSNIGRFSSVLPGELEYSLSVASFIRAGSPGLLTLSYSNIGGTDIPAPLFDIESDNASFLLAGSTDQYVPDGLEVLGYSPTGLGGVLAPGASNTIQIQFQQITSGAHVPSNFDAYVLGPQDSTTWDTLKSDLKPVGEPQAAWDVIYSNFEQIVGTTVQSYESVLDGVASDLSIGGERTGDASVLLQYILQIAGNFGQITQQYKPSDFGSGNPDPYNLTATADAKGNVSIGDDGQYRIFLKQADGSYIAGLPNDTGALTLSGGAYTLTETNGSKTVFRGNGTLKYVQDAAGNKTTATVVNGLVTALTAADGDTTSLTYNSANQVIQMTDPVGRITTFTYDSSGNLTSSTDAQGATTFTYAVPSTHAVTKIHSPDGTVQNFKYDSFGRISQQSQAGGLDPITFTYDEFGNTTETDALGHASTVTRGLSEQVIAITNALGNVLTFNSSSGAAGTPPDTLTGPDGSQTTVAYNAAGQPTSTTNSAGDTSSVTYNAKGLPASLTDADGNTTTFNYDANGNPAAITDPTHQATIYTYNAQGETTSSTSAAARVVMSKYNAVGLLKSQTFSDGTTASYTYDSHRNLLTATNSFGTETFTYDSTDRLTAVSYPNGLSLTYSYDSQGRLSQIVDQTGFATNYQYNAADQLIALTGASGSPIAAYTYNAAGQLTDTQLGNGTHTTDGYDNAGNLISVMNYAADGSVDSSFAYTYNANAQITSMVTAQGTTTYTYDTAGQLIGAVLPGGRTLAYSYDPEGNRISTSDSSVTTAYSTDSLNQYTAAGGTTYEYDADGNMISSTTAGVTTAYAYNALNELASMTTPTDVQTYQYDALGHRIATTDNGVTTYNLIDPSNNNELVGQFSSGGAVVSHYTYGIGLTSQVDASNSANYYDFDASGNTADLTGPAGTTVSTETYLPFGGQLSSTGSATNPFTFQGKFGVTNQGNGLYLTATRLYDSNLGRFIQRDPTNIAGGDSNLYRYAGNDPINHTDPSGRLGVAVDFALDIVLDAAGNFVGFMAPTEAATIAATLTAGGAAAPVALTGATTATAVAEGTFVSTLPATTGVFFDTAGTLLGSSAGAGSTTLGVAEAAAAPIVFGAETAPIIAGTGTQVLTQAVPFTAGEIAGGTALSLGDALLPVLPIALSLQYVSKYNREFPDGTPVPTQDVLNPEAYRRALKNPLVRQLVKDVTNGGGTLSQDTLNQILQMAAQSMRMTMTQSVTSHDPNEIVGPAGVGTGQFIAGGTPLPYSIGFTNDANASAPAATVTVTQQLSTELDWSTFQLGNISFGSTTITVPSGLTQFATTVDLPSTLGVDVRVTANFDSQTGLATWTFASLDPSTQDVPSNPLLGFLPPDDSTGRGEGFVSYTIQPADADATGDIVNAQATIVFDANAPISTSAISNTIDVGAPTGTITPLAADQTTTSFLVSWSGQDDAGGSGIATYNVYVSEDGGTFAPLVVNTTTTSTTFTGSPGHSYGFYTVATDNVGNVQPTPSAAQSTTTVVADTATLESDGTLEVFGGTANDTIVLSASGKFIDANIDGTAQTPVKTKHVSSIVIDGGDGDDLIRVANHLPPAMINGGAGNDTIIARNSGDTLIGGAGNDSLTVKRGDNLLEGGAGNDTLVAGNGNDTLRGGATGDSIIGGPGNDLVAGNGGADTIVGSIGSDPGIDTINGGPGANVITGTSPGDSIVP